MGCKYFEVSAWTGDGFPDCIYQMTKILLESKIKEKDPALYEKITANNIKFIGEENPGDRFTSGFGGVPEKGVLENQPTQTNKVPRISNNNGRDSAKIVLDSNERRQTAKNVKEKKRGCC